jgi:putative ABC transport system ATP-binding protein
MTSREPLVQAKGVTKEYRQGAVVVSALSGVDLELFAGELAALVGPSGSGKTTLLNLIGALDAPTKGELTVGGEHLAALSRARAALVRLHRIGFVFQDYSLLPVLSALENVEYVLLLQGVPPDERRRRAREALASVGLDGHEDRRPAELSGGQQQRVAVARAIAARPLLVLADEPTANLDSQSGEALMDLMQRLNREEGVTFVLCTHDEKVMRRASRIVRLRDGRVVEDGVSLAVHAGREPIEGGAVHAAR